MHDNPAVERYDMRVAGIVRTLRRIADEVEVGGTSPKSTHYMQSAENIIHEVMWGVANLNLDLLVRAANQAQNHPRETQP